MYQGCFQAATFSHLFSYVALEIRSPSALVPTGKFLKVLISPDWVICPPMCPGRAGYRVIFFFNKAFIPLKYVIYKNHGNFRQ